MSRSANTTASHPTASNVARVLLRRLQRPRLGKRYPLTVRLRKIAAVGLAATAVALAMQHEPARAERTRPVLTTATDIARGAVLRPTDVRVSSIPESVVPAGALSRPEQAVGKLIAGPTRSGELLTDARLAGAGADGLTTDEGAAVVPITLHDSAVADLLHPGTKVDVVTLGPSHSHSDIGHDHQPPAEQVLAAHATVVMVTAAAEDAPSTRSGRLVLLEVPAEIATQVAAVALNQPVAVTLR